MDLLTGLVIFAIGFAAGKLHAYFKFVSLIKELADEAGIDIVKEIRESKDDETISVGKLKVETHGNMLYLFDMDTDTFICQGNTIPELAKAANELKHIEYAVVKHGTKVFSFENGESREVLA